MWFRWEIRKIFIKYSLLSRALIRSYFTQYHLISLQALQFLEKYSKEFGILRTKRLPVSGAFHSPLMRERESLIKIKKELTDMKITVPNPVRVYSGITGER